MENEDGVLMIESGSGRVGEEWREKWARPCLDPLVATFPADSCPESRRFVRPPLFDEHLDVLGLYALRRERLGIHACYLSMDRGFPLPKLQLVLSPSLPHSVHAHLHTRRLGSLEEHRELSRQPRTLPRRTPCAR